MALPMSAARILCKKHDLKLLLRRYCARPGNECVRVRFAPSPTGMLHLGGLRTALFNYLFAKSHNGRFILRIEDTDQTRKVPQAVEKLEAMLHWAGLSPDESPTVGGSYGPYIQSERLQLYKDSVGLLIQSGHAYKCFCTSKRLDLLRREAVKRGEVPRYDNKCRHLSQSEIDEKTSQNRPFVIRFKYEPLESPWTDLVYGTMHRKRVGEIIEGDFIIMKSDGFPTYHFANVVDDHHMKISHVLRGEEWSISTPKHIQLYQAFSWTQPQFAHLPLILNRDGTKLSKRQGDIEVQSYKEKNQDPNALLNYLTTINGGFMESTDGKTLEEMVQIFSLDRVNTHSSRLHPENLELLNQKHLIRNFSGSKRQQVIQDMRVLLQQTYSQSLSKDATTKYILEDSYVERILSWSLKNQRISTLLDLLSPSYEFLWVPNSSCTRESAAAATPATAPSSAARSSTDTQIIQQALDCIQAVEPFTVDSLRESLKATAAQHDKPFSEWMKILRKNLSDAKMGPPVAEMMEILGREETLNRLNSCLRR